MTLDLNTVQKNLACVRDEIAAAVKLSGRSANAVRVLAAVKYLEVEDLGTLKQAGIDLVGENRAQELIRKATAWPDTFEWHFIGQLQSRKVKEILPYVKLIHTVASESALEQLARHASSTAEVLIQVNIAGEEGKAGIAPTELPSFLEKATVRVVGLMTMPPFTEDPESNRRYFSALRELAGQHELPQLSMGTSQDYRVAVEEGATIVRLGSVLYR